MSSHTGVSTVNQEKKFILWTGAEKTLKIWTFPKGGGVDPKVHIFRILFFLKGSQNSEKRL